ncbi:hypothetical protein ADUPG1_002946 [Aduncisulcus paluster]|uniref:2-dehydro-3-deoxyphosphooctonate aldolase n=1 Tax=Aduncisulcus paluster TaxID=2918883 RepID=A0ABQ5KUV7_9EUKA|nr:hypothetical protein ADUPG1_002946 [Aduncisulcus paluster]
MENKILIALLSILIFACATPNKFEKNYPTYRENRNTLEQLEHVNDSTLHVTSTSTDPKYGYTELKPIMLGVYDCDDGADNRMKFFNALLGPNGEKVTAKRIKTCCPFHTLNSQTVGRDQKFGLLDVWELSYEGIETPLTIYINLYDQGEFLAPMGFTLKHPLNSN